MNIPKIIVFNLDEYVFQVIMQSVEKQEDNALLKSLIDLAESSPKFLRPQLDTIIQMCMEVIFLISVCLVWFLTTFNEYPQTKFA